jgi:hypothetical protein
MSNAIPVFLEVHFMAIHHAAIGSSNTDRHQCAVGTFPPAVLRYNENSISFLRLAWKAAQATTSRPPKPARPKVAARSVRVQISERAFRRRNRSGCSPKSMRSRTSLKERILTVPYARHMLTTVWSETMQ